MAVSSKAASDKMILKVTVGTKTKSIIYSNIDPTATDENVYAVASALGALQTNPIASVKRDKDCELINA